MTSEELKARTKKLGVLIIAFLPLLPNNSSGRAMANQLVRSATSIGANYRAACRAKSDADFLYKLKIVEEEADETLYWLEVVEESKMVDCESIDTLKKETSEILAIIVASIKTVRNRTISRNPKS